MDAKYCEEYKVLGLNIAYYRSLKGLSQLQLAEQIDISRTHMTRIETGTSSGASLDVVFRIAEVLEVPVSKLFEKH